MAADILIWNQNIAPAITWRKCNSCHEFCHGSLSRLAFHDVCNTLMSRETNLAARSMRRFAPMKTALTILLPECPRPDLVELIESAGITMIHKKNGDFVVAPKK